MSDKKQSSVEWLQKAIYDKLNNNSNNTYEEIINEAKAMHKEEIKEAYDAVIIDENGGLLDGKEYYNEIFGGKI